MAANSNSPDLIKPRPMVLTDLDSVIENEVRAYAFPWTRGIFVDCIEADHECWVLCRYDRIIGHGVLSVGAGDGHLLNVCVCRDEQGYGYGRQLALHMVERAFQRGALALFLEVRPSNVVAVRLYESIGFKEVGKRKNYYPSHLGHEDARVLVLDLERYFDVKLEP